MGPAKKNIPILFWVFACLFIFTLVLPSISTAAVPANWHWRNSLPQGNTLSKVNLGQYRVCGRGEIRRDFILYGRDHLDATDLGNRRGSAGDQLRQRDLRGRGDSRHDCHFT